MPDHRRTRALYAPVVALLLGVILLAAAGLRVGGHNWDQDQHLHPDERWMTRVTLDRVGWPPSLTLAEGLDPAHSPINPRPPGATIGYAYGALPVYLGKMVTVGLGALTGDPYYTGYNGTQQTGRVLAGLVDTLTVLLVYLIGWRVWGAGVGLVAAALYALAVLPIQIGHFYIVEPFLTTLFTATLLSCVWAVQTRRRRWLLAAGCCLGLALACKLSAAPLVLPVLAAVLLVGWAKRGWRLVAGLAVLVVLGGLVGWFVGDPFALLDAPTYGAEVQAQAAVQSGLVDEVYTRRYVGTWPVFYPLLQLGLLGVGPLVLLAGLLGMGRVATSIRHGPRGAGLLLLGAVAYFASIAFLEAKWVRYLLPLVPLVSLFAAQFACWLAAKMRPPLPTSNTDIPATPPPALPNSWIYGPLILLLLSALGGAVAFSAIYTQEHTRVQASRWIYANLAPGSRIGLEGNDDVLPRPLPGAPAPAQTYTLVPFDGLADRAPAEVSAQLAAHLEAVDYLLVSSTRVRYTVSALPWRYPVQARYYDLLFSGQLGFIAVHAATAYPRLFGHAFYDDEPGLDISFTEYDHPPVYLFHKEAAVHATEWAELFAEAVKQPWVAARHP